MSKLCCVPEFPTAEMQVAMCKATNDQFISGFICHIHKEALAAAPPPPLEIESALEVAKNYVTLKRTLISGEETLSLARALMKSWGRE